MQEKQINPVLKGALEFGPILGFVVIYLIYRDATFDWRGTSYSGFVAITAIFIPIILAGMGMLWALTGRISRMQILTAVLLVIFGGLGVWMNDDRLIKMKPTAAYLIMAAILGVGLLRGQSWLKYVMEDMLPLKDKGWMILTRRVALMFAASAVANEVVWRTQSEAFWVIFESLAMPVIMMGFFLTQANLFVEYGVLDTARKKAKPGRPGGSK